MDDLISRQAVLSEIETVCFSKEEEWIKFRADYGSNGERDLIINYIKHLPSVQPEQKTGHWINAKVGRLFPSNDFKCSECGNILNFDGVNCGRGDANYCPNCGARMEEVTDDADSC